MTEDKTPAPPKDDRYAKTLAQVAAEEMRRCAGDPNIAAVGFGLKFVGGKPQMRAALHYHVKEKLKDEKQIAARGSSPVPARVGAYDTDVLQLRIARQAGCPGSRPPTGERGGRREDPLVGGTSTTALSDFHSIPTGYGTLGGLCFDTASGDAMALSNAHVYGDDIGSDVIQPWLPGKEYLEASLKYLFCGGPLAHLFFWTAPSPLTGILSAAAAGAWIAAAASDAEDPSRWGQRVGAVPPAGARTDREDIHVEAEPPRVPFPGRHWETPTKWKYTRHATSGSTSETVGESRKNEHVLIGKRVLTSRPVYAPGDRVTICAQVFTSADTPAERFVTATCFPLADPSRTVRRILRPEDAVCARLDKMMPKLYPPVCVRGFRPQVAGLTQIVFALVQPPFLLSSNAAETKLDPAASPENPSGVDALRIPEPDTLWVTSPPSTHAEVSVYHYNRPVTATAYAANGLQVGQATSAAAKGKLHRLRLSGLEIVRIEVSGGGGEGFLAGLCVDKWPIDVQDRKVRPRWYTGQFDLARTEPEGDWAVVVVSQTLDDTATGGDPVRAARWLGGIVDSANAVETEFCVCTLLHDQTFHVARLVIE